MFGHFLSLQLLMVPRIQQINVLLLRNSSFGPYIDFHLLIILSSCVCASQSLSLELCICMIIFCIFLSMGKCGSVKICINRDNFEFLLDICFFTACCVLVTHLSHLNIFRLTDRAHCSLGSRCSTITSI